MSPGRMLVEWAAPWLVLYLGLSAETAGDTATSDLYHTQANVSVVLHTPALSRADRQICSTWGNFHFKTFDGSFLQLPSNCTYTFVRQCKSSYADFNVVIQRQETGGGVPVVKASLQLSGLSVQLSQHSISVDDTP